MILTHGSNSLPRGDGETITIGGRKYPVVTINGTKWLAENLDYKWEGLLINNELGVNSPSASYYNNDESTYGVEGNRYGLLYNYSAQLYLYNNCATVCPGCRYPTIDDWYALFDNPDIGWSNLKSNSGWPEGYNGSNPYGFNMKPSGWAVYARFEELGRYTGVMLKRAVDWAKVYFT